VLIISIWIAWPSIPISCCYGIAGSRGSVPCIVILKIRILQLFMRSESQFSQRSCIGEAVEGRKVIDVIIIPLLLCIIIVRSLLFQFFFTARYLCRGCWNLVCWGNWSRQAKGTGRTRFHSLGYYRVHKPSYVVDTISDCAAHSLHTYQNSARLSKLL
jgi:hypothetical protein